MPSFSNGDGTCGCDSGRRAGLPNPHVTGTPGCLLGPNEDVGVSEEVRRQRALTKYLASPPVARRLRANPTLRAVMVDAFLHGWIAHD